MICPCIYHLWLEKAYPQLILGEQRLKKTKSDHYSINFCQWSQFGLKARVAKEALEEYSTRHS